MDSNDLSLPFKAGQEAESRSFEEGYRSAWFRCKIKGISCRKGALGHRLEYYDYPDEKIRWVKLYQKPPCVVEGLELHKKMELMVRPRYPLFYRESDLPVPLPECDVIVISNDTWKVGDLVDWWCDGCFWSGKVTQILENEKVQIKLPDPPAGQGCFYEALSKDLRPSLSWSPECGWMVPMSGELNNGWHCARLNWLHEQDAQKNCSLRNVKTEFSSANLISETANSPDKGRDEYCTFAKSSTREDCYSLGSEENSNLATSKCLVSARSSGTTLESCIMNLEEIACKVRWLKGLLKYGHKWSDLMNRSWKFLEGHESHLQHLHVEDFVLQKGGLGEIAADCCALFAPSRHYNSRVFYHDEMILLGL